MAALVVKVVLSGDDFRALVAGVPVAIQPARGIADEPLIVELTLAPAVSLTLMREWVEAAIRLRGEGGAV